MHENMLYTLKFKCQIIDIVGNILFLGVTSNVLKDGLSLLLYD